MTTPEPDNCENGSPNFIQRKIRERDAGLNFIQGQNCDRDLSPVPYSFFGKGNKTRLVAYLSEA